jgi:hypothetical protein
VRKPADSSAVGGAAGEAGGEFRAGLAAVIAAHVLRGWELTILGLPSGSAVPQTVELETDDAVAIQSQ